MTTIDDIRKKHETLKSKGIAKLSGQVTHEIADLDALFAIIDAQASELTALRSENAAIDARTIDYSMNLESLATKIIMRYGPDWEDDPTPPAAAAPSDTTATATLSDKAMASLVAMVREGTMAVNQLHLNDYGIVELLVAELIEWWGGHIGPRGENMAEYVATHEGHVFIIKANEPKPTAPTASDTTDWCAFPPHRPGAILRMKKEGIALSDTQAAGWGEGEFIVMDGDPAYTAEPPAAPTPAAAAAQAAPLKLPRLAPTHHDSLTRLAKGEVARRNWQRSTYYKWPGMDRLLKMGYASEIRNGDFYRATITDKGHAYLAVIAAQGEGSAQ
jgi:hypothetical protein